MSDNIENDPDFIKWKKDVQENLIPRIDNSAVTISLMPNGAPDVKYAVELGLSIMLDKPIIIAVQPGGKIPLKLAKVADEIVEIDLSQSAVSALRVQEAMNRVIKRLGL